MAWVYVLRSTWAGIDMLCCGRGLRPCACPAMVCASYVLGCLWPPMAMGVTVHEPCWSSSGYSWTCLAMGWRGVELGSSWVILELGSAAHGLPWPWSWWLEAVLAMALVLFGHGLGWPSAGHGLGWPLVWPGHRLGWIVLGLD